MKLFIALRTLLDGVRTEERGATAVEYGLIVSLIALFIIGAVALVGTNLSNLFTTVAGNL